MPDSLASILKRAEEHGVLQRKKVQNGETEYLPTEPGKPAMADKGAVCVRSPGGGWIEHVIDMTPPDSVEDWRGGKSLYDTPPEGAMVALFPEISFSERLAAAPGLENSANPDELHVTLVYLGKAKDLSDPYRVIGVLEGLALESEPLTAKIGGVGVFNQETDGKRPLYAAIDCPGLAALRSELVSRLEQAGIEITSDHDFTPHMTLAYIEESPDLDKLTLPEDEFTFDTFVLGLGGEYQPVPFGFVGEKQNLLLTYPDESKTWRFVWQQHFRGKGCHGDFRAETGDYLTGWTVSNLMADAIKEPVETEAAAKKAVADDATWKMDLHTGEIKPRQIRGGVVRKGDLRCFPKGVEIPESWLDVEGVTDKPEPGEEIPVGATRHFPGVFVIVDKGTVEHGAKKSYVQEYFIHGKKWGDQRWVFRLLERTAKGVKDLESGWEFEPDEEFKADVLKSRRIVELGAGEKQGSEEMGRREFPDQVTIFGKIVAGKASVTTYKTKSTGNVWYRYDFEFDPPIMIPGKGENSWDIEDDSIYSISVPLETDSAEAITEAKKRIVKDILDAEPYETQFKADVLPPGVEEEQPRERTFWVMIQADPGPYVLSKEAVDKDWLPPKGVSALPKAIRSKIPEDMRYWETSGQKARDMRQRIVEELDVRELAGTATKQDLKWRPYLLQRHWWHGQVVIRGTPSDQHYDLRVKLNGKHWHLVLDSNPLNNDRMAAYEETKYSGSVTTVDGKKINVMKIGSEPVELAPGQPANPTKDTPAFIQTVDEGQARVIGEEPGFKKLEFKGGKLEGAWVFKLEEPGAAIGEFGVSVGPQTKAKPAFKYRIRRKSMDELSYVYICGECHKDFETPTVLEREPLCPECAKALPWRHYVLQRHNDHHDLRIGDDFVLKLSGTLLDNEPDRAEVSKESSDLVEAGGEKLDARKLKEGETVKLADGEIETLDAGQARYAKTQAGHQVEFKGGKLEGVFLFGPEGARPVPDLEHIDVEWVPVEPEPEEVAPEPEAEAPPLIPPGGFPLPHIPIIPQAPLPQPMPMPPAPGQFWLGDEQVSEGEKAGRRLRGDKVSLVQSIKDAWDGLGKKLQELISWASYEDQPPPSLFDVFKGDAGLALKEVGGEPWLFTWSSNTFKDRQGEMFSTKALEKYCRDNETNQEMGTYNLWHIPGTDFAVKKWQGVVGCFLVEAGPFMDSEEGRKALAFFQQHPTRHPSLAPEGWGCSVEYRYLPEEKKGDGTVYTWVWITRTSILPKSAAANIWTETNVEEVHMALSEHQKQAAEELFGKEWVETHLLKEGESRTKELEEAGVAHKAEQPAGEAEDEKAKKKPQEGEYEKPEGEYPEGEYPKPKRGKEEDEKASVAKFVTALREIADAVEAPDVKKLLADAATGLSAGNMVERGRGLQAAWERLPDGASRERLKKIVQAMVAGAEYPAPYAYPSPSEQYPYPQAYPSPKELVEQVAEALKEKFAPDLAPLAEGMTKAFARLSERLDALEKQVASQAKAQDVKEQVSWPRFMVQLQKASEAEESVVPETDPLASMKPREAAPLKSGADAFFGPKRQGRG